MKKILKISLFALLGSMVFGGAAAASRTTTVRANAEAQELNYITKEIKDGGLQVNNVNATQSRFSLAFLVPASVDHPAEAALRGGYYTDITSGSVHMTDLPHEEGFNATDVLNRTKALNFLQGNILVDDVPLTYRASAEPIRLWDTTQGRAVITKNADSETDTTKMRLKIAIDAKISGHDERMHTVTLKAGTELPSWSYLLGYQFGTTTTNTVYKTTTDMKWTLQWNGSSFTVFRKSYTNVVPEQVGLVGFNDTGVFQSGKVADGRVRFKFDTISPYARRNTHGYPLSYEPQTHFTDKDTDYVTGGNITQLSVFEKMLVNGEPIYKFYTDSRFRINDLSRLEDGASYGSFWIDLKLANLTDTITFTIEKGMQIPTPESYTDATKCTYLLVDRDWTFTIVKQSDFVWNVTNLEKGDDTGLYDEYCVPTTVVGYRTANAAADWSYGYFALSNYDNTTGKSTVFNNKYMAWSGQVNARETIYVDDDPAKGILSFGLSGGRYTRTTMDANGTGFPVNWPLNAEPFEKINIPAGTRFPAATYLTSNLSAPGADDLPSGNMKFFVTTEDTTLVKVDGKWITTTRAQALTDSDAYGSSFLDTVACDGGVTAPSVEAWNNMATAYAALSAEAKAIITEEAGAGSENVTRFLERYDYILAKYGTTNYSNFLARTVTPASTTNPLALNTVSGSTSVTLIAIIGLTSLVAVALIYRKKHQ